MYNKLLEEISAEDIQQLVDRGQMESSHLDYKRERPDRWRMVSQKRDNPPKEATMWAAKKEFLKDISALANARGGRLIYGVAENKGAASAVPGITCDNLDSLFNELQQLCGNNLDPPVRIECVSVGDFEKGPVIIVQIPNTWNKPHSVLIKHQRSFYKRFDTSVRNMEMNEIRRAFLQTAEIDERIRTFRKERVSKIKNGDMPVPLPEKKLLICHVIPVSTFAAYEYIDIDFQPGRGADWLQPLGSEYGSSSGYNIDGRYTAAGSRDENRKFTSPYAYAQLFRNGAIEGVEGTWIGEEISPLGIAKHLSDTFKGGWQRGMSSSALNGPFVVAISLVGWKGCKLYRDFKRHYPHDIVPIQSNELLIPEIMLSSLDGEPHEYLAPLFEVLWQTCGLSGYTESWKADLAKL